MSRFTPDNLPDMQPTDGLDPMDWQLLSDHIDEALSPGEMQQLLLRLSKEPVLAGALEQLRAAQQQREAVWTSLEPSDAVADRVAANVIRAARRYDWSVSFRRWSRTLSAAAASIAVGLSAGWWLWGRTAQMSGRIDHSPISMTPSEMVSNELVSNVPGTPGLFQVALTDEQGNVVAVQKFSRREEAERFARELGQVQRQRQDPQVRHPQLVSHQF